MTGGPNSRKRPIDYEFSTYDRNDLIFRFANVTEEQVERITKPAELQEQTNNG